MRENNFAVGLCWEFWHAFPRQSLT